MSRRVEVLAAAVGGAIALLATCALSLLITGVWPWQLPLFEHVVVPPVVLSN